MATVTMGRDWYLPMAGSVAGVVAVLAAAVAPAYGGVVDGTHDAIVRVCFVGDAVAKKQEDVSFIWRHLKMFENHGHIKFVLMDNDGRCPNPRPSGDARFEANDGDLRIGVPGTLDYDGKTPITGLKLGKGAPIRGRLCGGRIFPATRTRRSSGHVGSPPSCARAWRSTRSCMNWVTPWACITSTNAPTSPRAIRWWHRVSTM
jgi:hypothetical protein